MLLPKDLFRAFLVVQAAQPYLGAVFEAEAPVGLIQGLLDTRERQSHYLGECVLTDGDLGVVEAETKNRVTRTRGLKRAEDDVAAM